MSSESQASWNEDQSGSMDGRVSEMYLVLVDVENTGSQLPAHLSTSGTLAHLPEMIGSREGVERRGTMERGSGHEEELM